MWADNYECEFCGESTLNEDCICDGCKQEHLREDATLETALAWGNEEKTCIEINGFLAWNFTVQEIDITCKPLASMYFMQIVWGLRKDPFIGVRPLNHAKEAPSTGAWQFTNAIDSWSWQGYEGEKAVVEVYADAAAVRLSLNGKEVGTKPVRKYKAMFKLPYGPGTLTAEALDERGKLISRHSLTTAGKETVLCAIPEKTVLRAGSQELCYLPIEFTDQEGDLKPYMEQRVEITVNGAATLAGFGSALCKTDEVFCKPYHDSYRGRCLAVLRAKDSPGKGTVTIKSAGVKPVMIVVEVK